MNDRNITLPKYVRNIKFEYSQGFRFILHPDMFDSIEIDVLTFIINVNVPKQILVKNDVLYTNIRYIRTFYHVFHPFTDGKVKNYLSLRQVVCIFDEMYESKLNLFLW